ncbi:MAG: hypothetical protein EOM63_02620, partial [Clostridia bacterium]|nr:hypothetical protein [Clostridia bacterium]
MELDKVCAAFRAHGFAVTYFERAADATAYLATACAGHSVSFGGSMTLDTLGAYDALTNAGATVHWHWKNGGVRVQDSEIYVTSANGLSQTGEIVNLDGSGNRVSAAIYGPKRCYTVCGVNKLEPTLADAIRRTREIAALNGVLAERVEKTPEVTVLSGPERDGLGYPSVRCSLRKHAGKSYLIAVNSTLREVEASFRLPGLKKGVERNEKRRVALKDSVLADRFGPLPEPAA